MYVFMHAFNHEPVWRPKGDIGYKVKVVDMLIQTHLQV